MDNDKDVEAEVKQVKFRVESYLFQLENIYIPVVMGLKKWMKERQKVGEKDHEWMGKERERGRENWRIKEKEKIRANEWRNERETSK